MSIEELQKEANPAQFLLPPEVYVLASEGRICGASEIIWKNLV